MNLDAGGQSTWFFIEIFLRCIYIYVCMFVCIYIRQIESQIMTNQQFAKRRRPVIVRAAQVDLIRPLNPAPHIVSIHELPFLYRNGAFTFNFFLNYLFFSFGRTKYEKKMTTFAVWELTSVNKFFRPSTTCLQRVWMSCPQISVHGRKLHWNVTTNQRDVHRFWNPWLVGLVTVQREIIFFNGHVRFRPNLRMSSLICVYVLRRDKKPTHGRE